MTLEEIGLDHQHLPHDVRSTLPSRMSTSPEKIAIVGIGLVFPNADTPAAFWRIIRGATATATDVPAHRWTLEPDSILASDSRADSVLSKRACLIDDFHLDADGLALDTDLLESLDPMFHLALRAGRSAWRDARTEHLDRTRVGVVLGNIALPTDASSRLADELLGEPFLASLSRQVAAATGRPLDVEGLHTPLCGTDPLNRYVAGLPAGILAQALGLGQGNHTLDAACASSLYALKLAADELRDGRADAMLAGGLSRPDSLYTQMGFSQLRALSPTGRCAPFDVKADGLVVGEGCGMVVLKRLCDAERDGDRIYGLLAGIGLSNDLGANLMAPNSEGQLRAMRAAYAQAGWQPADVQLVECHGTGTPIGDAVEFASLSTLWQGQAMPPGACTIGSVKSNIGHTLTAAGAAGLIKTLLAMHHGELPPTASFTQAPERLNLSDSPFRVLREPLEWPDPTPSTPRKAAVSAFGFGGINAHVLIEEHRDGASSDSVFQPRVAPGEPIAIIGMDAWFGPWTTLQAVQARLFGTADDCPPVGVRDWWGRRDAAEFHGFAIDELSISTRRFRIPPTELADMLPQQLLMLEVATNALVDAGIIGMEDDPGRDLLDTGIFVGIGLDPSTTNFHFRWTVEKYIATWLADSGIDLDSEAGRAWHAALVDTAGQPLSPNRTMGALGGIVASRLARAFRVGGPSFAIASEETSGLRALDVAVRALQRHELRTALVGAVDLAADPRSVLTQHRDRPYRRTGGPLVGEGAGALVLKRLTDAVADGDRVVALIRGVGSAGGPGRDRAIANEDSYRRAWNEAYRHAQIDPECISLLEVHGSGDPREDAMEASALTHLFANQDRMAPCRLASSKAALGHTGAAAGLAAVIQISLSLEHHRLPAFAPQGAIPATVPVQSSYWLHDRADGPRRAGVSGFSVDGSCHHVVLEASDTSTTADLAGPVAMVPGNEHLLSAEAATADTLTRLLADLADLARRMPEASLGELQARWMAAHPPAPELPLAAALIARDHAELTDLAGKLTACVQAGRACVEQRAFFTPAPSARGAGIALVYPGSGNQYAGMGRCLGLHWPTVLKQQDAANARYASQFADGRFWNSVDQECNTLESIFGHVWLGSVVTDVLRASGLMADAIIGYSLGESTGLIANRIWPERDAMLARMHDSDLFTGQLAGPCLAARRVWDLADSEPVNWRVGVIDRPAEAVREALEGRARVYLLIVNTPTECVIGGDATAVSSLVDDLGGAWHPLDGVTTVHCELVRPVLDAYRALHHQPTIATPEFAIYSAAAGCCYDVTAESAADSIARQASAPFDFTRLIETAYADGIRVFVETGPGGSCTRMIDAILADRPHVARSSCVHARDEQLNVLQVIGHLLAERAPLDRDQVSRLAATPAPAPSRDSAAQLVTPTRRGDFAIPAVPVTTAALGAPPPPDMVAPLLHNMLAVESARAATQQSFLRVASGMTERLGRVLDMQQQVLRQLHQQPVPVERITPDRQAWANPVNIPTSFCREACLEFATGSIARVLGADFDTVDGHPVRVRLPDEPLMLVDRILDVEGEPMSLGPGRIITEHDVEPEAWYLDCGRIPTCIAVEAGQADLFLSAYLGIDAVTRGSAVYRLLDAEITFHGPLARAGQTIRYDIHIDHFFNHGDTRLFRFRFDASVGGELMLTMRNGCAGFFSPYELETGRGLVDEVDQTSAPGEANLGDASFVPLADGSYSAQQLSALRRGDLVGCFGEPFADLKIEQPLTLPAGRMVLVHRILELTTTGGPFGLGQIIGEADIAADDWFLVCHFVDDQVMPGTLMYECCLHTLRILLLRLGWVGERDQVAYEPIAGATGALKCRGQVTAKTRQVQYEISIREIGFEAGDGVPYAIAHARMYADHRPVVDMANMSLRLSGLTKRDLVRTWSRLPGAATASTVRPALFHYHRILAFATGKPSDAFGDRYRVFDAERRIARLPGPPYQFLDRIVSIEDCKPWQLSAGGTIEAEYDVPADAWYFAANRQREMPFAILLEVALQPCGWLAAYLGSALTSDTDLSFRNLGGRGQRLRDVHAGAGTLTTRVTITSVSRSGGMIIQNYDLEVRDRKGPVYRGDTVFGFFSAQALSDQVGIRDADLYEPEPRTNPQQAPGAVPDYPPFPDTAMRMLTQVTRHLPDGGRHGLGFIEGKTAVDASAWFFKAHFFQDPVWPGSLGLESFLQLLKVAASRCWPDRIGADAEFVSQGDAIEHAWLYRGQILPGDKQVRVQAEVTARDNQTQTLRADGFLQVDGRVIYQLSNFSVRLLSD